MNWIDEEAEKFRAEKEQARAEKELEERKAQLIKRADYWADLKRQVEKDVEQINKMDIWQDQLKDIPLKINFLSGSYKIEKESFPQVFVDVYNEEDDIEITTEIKKNEKSESEELKEVFTVNSDGRKVFLKNDKGTLHIPEQAAKYILTPFVKALAGKL